MPIASAKSPPNHPPSAPRAHPSSYRSSEYKTCKSRKPPPEYAETVPRRTPAAFSRPLPRKSDTNPSELPLMSAKRTNHAALSPIAFQPQHSKERPPPAQRTNSRRLQHRRYCRPPRQVSGVRLQKRPREKLCKRPNLLIEHSSQFPIRRQKCDPRFGWQRRNLPRSRCQCVGSILLHQRKEIPEVRQQQREIQSLAHTCQTAALRLRHSRIGKLRDKAFLKTSDSLVERKKIAGGRFFRDKFLGAPDPRVVLIAHRLWQCHFFGVAGCPVISSYHAGWYRLAKVNETSPRITEPNAPRSANTPM